MGSAGQRPSGARLAVASCLFLMGSALAAFQVGLPNWQEGLRELARWWAEASALGSSWQEGDGSHRLGQLGKALLVALVATGVVPITAASFQFGIIGRHGKFCHHDRCRPVFPRISIVVPAWNEGMVIAATVDQLMRMAYPSERLRVYVVDDASTDETPQILQAKEQEYPGRVFHVRREKGGEGKAHTLNHGLRQILSESWTEAVLIIDADVRFEKEALRRMTRHLADPQVGAVTAYIKEGSRPGNFMNRFIGFEYITAQAASRRAQNVLGAMACLAGGAQLLSRRNLEAIGGQIDTSSLAEDTFTTFKTQLGGRRAIFEGNAIVWAEEPCDVTGLWKQRLRWARGNVQLTRHYRDLWFRRGEETRLGGFAFGYLWFSIFLMPVFMVLAASGLVSLFFVDFPISWVTFRLFWIVNALNYFFVNGFSFAIDPETARKSWFQGFLFPGWISLLIILYSCFPEGADTWLISGEGARAAPASPPAVLAILGLYGWIALCMPVAWMALRVESIPRLRWLARPLVYLAGYGPLLCAVTFASYLYELRGAEMKWEKTEKTGKVSMEGKD